MRQSDVAHPRLSVAKRVPTCSVTRRARVVAQIWSSPIGETIKIPITIPSKIPIEVPTLIGSNSWKSILRQLWAAAPSTYEDLLLEICGALEAVLRHVAPMADANVLKDNSFCGQALRKQPAWASFVLEIVVPRHGLFAGVPRALALVHLHAPGSFPSNGWSAGWLAACLPALLAS